MGPPKKILIVDADPAWVGLLDEWLGAEGIDVVHERAAAADDDATAGCDCDLAIVEVPHPRGSGASRLARIRNAHPALPIIAVSAAFFARIACCGRVAREFGVASALPKPLSRDALLAEVRRLLAR